MVGSGPPAVVAASLAALAGRLGLLAERREALEADDPEVRDSALAALRDRLRDFDVDADGSSFWNGVFEVGMMGAQGSSIRG